MQKLVLIFFMLLSLSACSPNEAEQNEVEGNTENTRDESNIFPLTGIEKDDDRNNRVVSVMVNNHPNARPQSGLSKADIVFEMLTEGNVTRFLALYQSELPEVVGPVRSAREYYFNLANDYNALYVYHGADGFINDMIKTGGTDFINGSSHDNDGILFKRESFRKAPHNSYLQFDAVYNAAKQKGYETTANDQPMPFLNEEGLSEIQGEAADQVEIAYSNNPRDLITYDYDEEEAVYNRYIGGVQMVEYTTEEPIQADNILIVEADHQVIDKQGRREIDLQSGGDAYLLQEGKMQTVEWENRNGRIIPVENGNPVGLVPGKTWINILPATPGIETSVTVSD